WEGGTEANDPAAVRREGPTATAPHGLGFGGDGGVNDQWRRLLGDSRLLRRCYGVSVSRVIVRRVVAEIRVIPETPAVVEARVVAVVAITLAALGSRPPLGRASKPRPP